MNEQVGGERLFQYAAFYRPTSEERKKGERAKLIVEVTTCVAPSAEAATLIAARAIPEEYVDRLDRVEVAVRPF